MSSHPVGSSRHAPGTFGRGRRGFRAEHVPGPGTRAWAVSDQQWPRYFGPALALYTAIVISRLNEVIPHLDRMYPGKVFGLLLIGTAVAEVSARDFSRVLGTRVAKCIAVISVLAILSVPGSAWPRQSVSFFQVQWPQTLLMFVCVLVGFMNRRTAYVSLVAVTFTAGLGALEMVVGAGLSNQGRAYIGGDVSATYDPNASAALFVTVLPYAVFLATRPGRLRTPAAVMIPVLIAALIKTSSRGGAIALGVLGIALIVFAPKQRRWLYASVFAAMLLTLVLVPHSGLVERFSQLSGSQDYNFSSRDGRLEVWKRGFGMMLTHPLFGVGVRAFEVANGNLAHSWINAHNAVVQIGAELGIGGLVAFLIAVIAAFQAAVATVRRTRAGPVPARDSVAEFDRGLATAALCSLIAELTAAMFLSMAYDAMTLFVMAVPTSLALGTAVVAARGGALMPGLAMSSRQPGWRSARRVTTPLSPPAPKPQV